ncbi:MAG: sugar ABC transporter permease [Clostridiales bacterium]|nr:sugar ABC transporter permease [Clostridiales bacterium]
MALPKRSRNVLVSIGNTLASYWHMFVRGDWATKLSFLVMGFGCLRRGQVVKGLLYLLVQIAFWIFFLGFGIVYIAKLGTLGTETQNEVWNEDLGIFEYTRGDNSMLVLLYGIVSLLIVIVYLVMYFSSLRASYEAERLARNGQRVPTLADDIRSYANENFHKTLLFLPSLAVVIFTILPLLFMIMLAFTNYDRFHMPPGNLFTWVGFENFRALVGFGDNPLLGSTFRNILGWTLVWAFFATITNYTLGMILAIIINKKGIRFKKFFRTIFVLTIAIPQFVSLMFMRNLLAETGLVNVFLQQMGWIDAPIRFLTDGTIAKFTVIAVNMWVGIPYSMLITTGILLNIPDDLYEASRIDGASPAMQFFKITLPYVMFVTTPYLITQFVGNINNFNVIWFLSGGGPMSGEYYQGGKTDLLITWLYRITTGEQNYKLASVIGIATFVVCAVFSLIVYSRTGSANREGDFQ